MADDYSDYGSSDGFGAPGTSYTTTPDTPATGGSFSDIFGSIGNVLSGGSGSMAQLAGLGGLGALINSIGGSGGSTYKGFQGSIPQYTASRTQLPIPPSGSQSALEGASTGKRRPGSGGVTYFTPMQYTPVGAVEQPAGIANLPAMGGAIGAVQPAPLAQPVAQDDPFFQSAEYKAFQNDPNSMVGTHDMYTSPYFGRMSSGSVGQAMDRAYEKYKGITPRSNPVNFSQFDFSSDTTNRFAAGGIANLGSYSDGGRLLRGPGDGVSDDIPAIIGQKQPARLADGEFVIPARIVSEIGNGSTDAGARKLYAMMDRVQKARGKTLKNVAANSKADKHLPA
jgi:hypothetical protein